jgi:hypothetical protein
VTQRLRSIFPNLAVGEYEVTSNRTKRYNCIAWAAGDSGEWWEPTPGYKWPVNVPRDDSVESAKLLFESLGYEVCDDAKLEIGYSKVAIYADSYGSYTHAAKQLENGKWSSKLGKLQDIQHDELESICSKDYGIVSVIMKRKTIKLVASK